MITTCTGCSDRPITVTSGNAGSVINSRGEITDSSTDYIIPVYKKSGSLHDLFNHIYFSGDELFFSFTITGKTDPDSIDVFFVNPLTGGGFATERLEYKRNDSLIASPGIRIYGFSLIGSLLEKFYAGDLKKPIPPGALCCRPIPVIIRLSVSDGEKKLSKEIKTSFTIQYK